MGIKIFGAILIVLGLFFIYGIFKASLPLVFGQKVKAKIVGIEKEKWRKHTQTDYPSYVYYPILEFEYKNKTIKLTNNFQHDFEESFIKSNTEMTIYYSEKYGASNGFGAVEIIFLIIGIVFSFFGVVCFFLKAK